MKSYIVITVVFVVLFAMFMGSEPNSKPAAPVEFTWRYVDCPSGNCYELGLDVTDRYGIQISGQVAQDFCK